MASEHNLSFVRELLSAQCVTSTQNWWSSWERGCHEIKTSVANTSKISIPDLIFVTTPIWKKPNTKIWYFDIYPNFIPPAYNYIRFSIDSPLYYQYCRNTGITAFLKHSSAGRYDQKSALCKLHVTVFFLFMTALLYRFRVHYFFNYYLYQDYRLMWCCCAMWLWKRIVCTHFLSIVV